MIFLVPFDDSTLSRAALARADEFGAALGKQIFTVTVIPVKNASYARTHGWLDDDESYDQTAIVERLRTQVTDISPDATFRYELVDKYAPPGTISNRVRAVARNLDTSMIFVGSGNAGHFVSSISSIGSGVAAEHSYDIAIIRTAGK